MSTFNAISLIIILVISICSATGWVMIIKNENGADIFCWKIDFYLTMRKFGRTVEGKKISRQYCWAEADDAWDTELLIHDGNIRATLLTDPATVARDVMGDWMPDEGAI